MLKGVGTAGMLVENNNNNSTMWPRLKSFIYLPKRCILQHTGKYVRAEQIK